MVEIFRIQRIINEALVRDLSILKNHDYTFLKQLNCEDKAYLYLYNKKFDSCLRLSLKVDKIEWHWTPYQFAYEEEVQEDIAAFCPTVLYPIDDDVSGLILFADKISKRGNARIKITDGCIDFRDSHGILERVLESSNIASIGTILDWRPFRTNGSEHRFQFISPDDPEGLEILREIARDQELVEPSSLDILIGASEVRSVQSEKAPFVEVDPLEKPNNEKLLIQQTLEQQKSEIPTALMITCLSFIGVSLMAFINNISSAIFSPLHSSTETRVPSYQTIVSATSQSPLRQSQSSNSQPRSYSYTSHSTPAYTYKASESLTYTSPSNFSHSSSEPQKQAFAFPMSICGDRDPGGSNTWHPVYVNYSEQNIRRIRANYCQDSIRKYRPDIKLHSIQVASFLNRQDAEEFAKTMRQRVGSGEVGPSSVQDFTISRTT